MKSLSKVIKSFQYDRISGPRPEGSGPQEGLDGIQRKAVMDGAFEKAKQIVDSAQAYSVQIEREASEKGRAEYEKARKSGYDDGFAQGMTEGKKTGEQAGRLAGYEEGEKKAEAQCRKTLDELTRMIETVEKNKTEILSQFEDGVEELAFTIAKTILKKELSLSGDALRSIITAATDSYRNQTWLRIHLSEKDAGTLLKADVGIAETLEKVSDNVKIVSEPEMEDGGCIIEMPEQVIDAGVDSQFQKIKTAVESSERDKTG